ncbi:MAG: hypothetical protein KDA44_11420 [Planctomycetales bacterium]|nr:hypothetical protein [Planctomycetales bacterium]
MNDADEYARYTAGLNDFRYRATLFFEHTVTTPDEVIARVELAPRQIRRIGEPRTTPRGNALNGLRSANHVSFELPTIDEASLDEFAGSIADRLEKHGEFFRCFTASGGTIELFVGIFARRGCDTLFPPVLSRRLGELGVGLRLDYYADTDSPSSTTDEHQSK